MYELPITVPIASQPLVPPAAMAVGLFGLLGLTISAAVLPHYQAAEVFWTLLHIE